MAPGFWRNALSRKSTKKSVEERLVRTVVKLEIRHRIENFRSAMRLSPKDEAIFSEKVFSPLAPEFVWQLDVRPNNGKNGSSFYLRLTGPAVTRQKSRNVTYTVALKDQSDKCVCTVGSDATNQFSPGSYSWGWAAFSHTSLLGAIQPDGSLLAVANLEFYADVPTSGSSKTPPNGAASNRQRGLGDSLASLLKSGMLSDFTIEVGKKQLSAHRCILAVRSPVFEAMLTNNSGYEEARSGVLKIDEFAKQPVEGMLSFIYTDVIDDAIVDKWQESLLQLADKYQLDEMKSLMEEKIAASLCVETLVSTAILADAHRCTALKEACVAFLRSNFDQVTSGEMWKELMRGSRVSVAAELLQMVHGGR